MFCYVLASLLLHSKPESLAAPCGDWFTWDIANAFFALYKSFVYQVVIYSMQAFSAECLN